ncbi:small membrane protein [Klebsiella pneumoniae]
MKDLFYLFIAFFLFFLSVYNSYSYISDRRKGDAANLLI